MKPDEPAWHEPETEHFTAASKAKLPRRKLGPGTLALLVLLRIYVLLAIPIVAYAFLRALRL